MADKRKVVIFDRDPREMSTTPNYVGSLQRLADADIALIIKGDEAEIIKLRWADPGDFDVEVVRP